MLSSLSGAIKLGLGPSSGLDALKSLNVHGKRVLFVMPEDSDNLFLSLRNVLTVEGTLLADINTLATISSMPGAGVVGNGSQGFRG